MSDRRRRRIFHINFSSHGIKEEEERHAECAVCGGKLVVFVDVDPHPTPSQQDHPRTKYFRCERCAQIQIVDE